MRTTMTRYDNLDDSGRRSTTYFLANLKRIDLQLRQLSRRLKSEPEWDAENIQRLCRARLVTNRLTIVCQP